MKTTIYKIISGVVLLMLAMSQCIFLGYQKDLSLIISGCLVIESILSYYLKCNTRKIKLFFIGIIVPEVLFFFSEKFIFLVIGIFLLIATGVYHIASIRPVKKRSSSVIAKCIYGLLSVLTVVLLLINIYTKPITEPKELPAHISAQIDDDLLDSETVMLHNIKTMNSFGSRVTGSEGQQEFIDWLKKELTNMGLEIHSDKYTFNSWEEEKSSLYINGEEIHISSAFPYSGETDEKGVTGELVYTTAGKYEKAKGKIAVIEIDNTKKIPLGLVMNERITALLQNKLTASDGDLVLTTALQEPKLEEAKEKGALAVILVWKGVSDEKAEDQYLSFITDYAGIPAVWVNASEGRKVLAAAKLNKTATVILEANKQPKAETESFYVSIPGKNTKEALIINSHTDGVNVVEENGAVGMLSMIRYLQKVQPERTIVFAFITGHFRLPVFQGTSQATSTWMQAHPELWDGKEGHLKAVAGITVEHLGSMEWKENKDGIYEKTGNLQTEYTYTGNEMMSAVWIKSVEERKTQRTVLLRGHNRFEFGESQPLFEAGIPVIGFIPMPDYLMVNSDNREMDKFDTALMREQIISLLKAAVIIDQMTAEQLGVGERYTYFYGMSN
ncbi:PA domain-containing protein [Anaerocolumna sp. AGMB13020]|uniref:PA domain-containing protein n=1 Tax=Anaerocolumna sp. AGMB13020 TaxID=3081750 RepID=UPI00295532B3|nr:PA domain-containing protein [Anaerocolumna sp. AGMB13020]WOO37821.1 PA domain-containing protein [Anaerocolumna sp. AGMB13020]